MDNVSQYLPAALLGLGLAASCGLNTFLPLLVLASAAKWHLFGVQLGGNFAWLGSDSALLALSLATVAEVVADKIPVVDHGLDMLGTVARPAAGALAAASVFKGDPAMAAMIGLVLGAPTAFGFHAAKAGTRAGSSTTTFGMANPLLSFIEDALSLGFAVLSILFPWLVPLLIVLFALVAWRLWKLVRSKLPSRLGSATS
ncbi:MAG: hypothetical protein JWN98_866 [Abditibacteriota bacterium]|nr:hypothetical protein [Abditibacteriota bacterium]